MVEKVSDITVNDIIDYINLDEVDDKERNQLSTFLTIAKNFILNYTGVKDLDEYADFVIVVYILCQDMYDNRTMYIEKGSLNKVVQTILDMHTMNNL